MWWCVTLQFVPWCAGYILVNSGVEKHLPKGVIVRVPLDRQICFTIIFVSPKKDRSPKMVLNSEELDTLGESSHFKRKSIKSTVM